MRRRGRLLFVLRWTRTRAVLLLLVFLLAPARHGAAQNSAETRTVLVGVVDDTGAPVSGLEAADFVVKEDGHARAVVRVTPARAPMAIALLLDDGGVGINDIGRGVAGFLNRVQGYAQVSMTGIAEQNRRLVDLTADPPALMGGLRQLGSRAARGGGYALEAVLDATESLMAREAVRPVVVMVTNQNNEYGTLRADGVLQRLTRTGTTFFVIEVTRASGQGTQTAGRGGDAIAQASANAEFAEGNRERARFLEVGPKDSGGRRIDVVVPAAIPVALGAVADELLHQYDVTYRSDAGAETVTKLSVSVRRGRVHAPARTTGRTR